MRRSEPWQLSLLGLGLLACTFHAQAGHAGTTAPTAPAASTDGTVQDEPWMLELPSADRVRQTIQGSDEADSKARQDAAFKVLIDYIDWRVHRAYYERRNPASEYAPTAAKRRKEYMDASAIRMANGSTNYGNVVTPEASRYYHGDTVLESLADIGDYHLEVLSKLLSADSIAWFRAEPAYQTLRAAKERRVALIRHGRADKERDERALESAKAQARANGERGLVEFGKLVSRATALHEPWDQTSYDQGEAVLDAMEKWDDWTRSNEGQLYFSELADATRAKWRALRERAVSESARLVPTLNAWYAQSPAGIRDAREAQVRRCQSGCWAYPGYCPGGVLTESYRACEDELRQRCLARCR